MTRLGSAARATEHASEATSKAMTTVERYECESKRPCFTNCIDTNRSVKAVRNSRRLIGAPSLADQHRAPKTSALIGAEPTSITGPLGQSMSAPVMRHGGRVRPCLFAPHQRTFVCAIGMSAKCHRRHSAEANGGAAGRSHLWGWLPADFDNRSYPPWHDGAS